MNPKRPRNDGWIIVTLSLVLAVFRVKVRYSDDIRYNGHHPNGFLELSYNDRAILFLVILLDKTLGPFRKDFVRRRTQSDQTLVSLRRSPPRQYNLLISLIN